MLFARLTEKKLPDWTAYINLFFSDSLGSIKGRGVERGKAEMWLSTHAAKGQTSPSVCGLSYLSLSLLRCKWRL